MGNSKFNVKEYSKKYDTHRAADMRLVEKVIDKLEITETKKILDFGCGTGNYLEALKLKGYSNLFGLDPSEDMRKIAFEKTALTIKDGSHLNIPYEDNFFDAVFLINSIHFIDDLKALFNNLQRVCKKDASIFIATQSRKLMKNRFYNKYFPSLLEIDYKRYHEIEKIVSTAQQSGFSLRSNHDFINGTDMPIDKEYFSLVQNKAFSIFALLPEDEFNKGISLFKEDMKDGGFVAKFAGYTIIILQKNNES
ncbi:MAG: class I SAM-dependent methyltransferase [Tannerella sp.]|jgi:ubiquinone/menaquinone biosynthesis C-methylase UbiE|nr:class I SAM-dependent methyltransferase [Tannerella sp.]